MYAIGCNKTNFILYRCLKSMGYTVARYIIRTDEYGFKAMTFLGAFMMLLLWILGK